MASGLKFGTVVLSRPTWGEEHHRIVLDLGCGDGEFLTYVRCARRVGVDGNPDAARKLDSSIEFHRGSISDLSFLPNDSIDASFTSNVLEHLASKDEVAKVVLVVTHNLVLGTVFGSSLCMS